MNTLPAPTKLDLRSKYRSLYVPTERGFHVVDVPPFSFLMIDGSGDPNEGTSFQEAIQALFATSYTLKFMVRGGPLALDYSVMPLEALWSGPAGSPVVPDRKDEFFWTSMVMQPEFVSEPLVASAIEVVRKKHDSPSLSRLRIEQFTEGRAAQIMYRGPYSAEGPTIDHLHEFIRSRGGRLRGRHHEIYLGDPRRARPENLRTVIRQPFE